MLANINKLITQNLDNVLLNCLFWNKFTNLGYCLLPLLFCRARLRSARHRHHYGGLFGVCASVCPSVQIMLVQIITLSLDKGFGNILHKCSLWWNRLLCLRCVLLQGQGHTSTSNIKNWSKTACPEHYNSLFFISWQKLTRLRASSYAYLQYFLVMFICKARTDIWLATINHSPTQIFVMLFLWWLHIIIN